MGGHVVVVVRGEELLVVGERSSSAAGVGRRSRTAHEGSAPAHTFPAASSQFDDVISFAGTVRL